jgi:hypothetical protein
MQLVYQRVCIVFEYLTIEQLANKSDFTRAEKFHIYHSTGSHPIDLAEERTFPTHNEKECNQQRTGQNAYPRKFSKLLHQTGAKYYKGRTDMA